MKSEIHNKQDKKYNILLEWNLTPRKISIITSMIEQMFESRAWNEFRGPTENSQCSLCKKQRETMQHLLAGLVQSD